MQCDNCGYIFFQPSKKCACCSAPYAPTQTAFDIGQESLFTIFEMAPGEGGISTGMATVGAGVGVEDYGSFTDDFDMGGAEYGVDENVLDLSEAEAEGFGPASAPASADDFDFDSAGMSGMDSFGGATGPDDFELDLSESTAAQASVPDEAAGMEPEAEIAVPDISPEPEPEVSLDVSPESGEEVDAAADADFGGSGFDSEVEGLGFGFDESPAGETAEPEAATEEVTLDAEPEAEISLEPELELPADDEEEPSLELSDDEDEGFSLELPDDEDEGISLELSDEPELDMGDEEIALSDETGDLEEEEDSGSIDFDLDSVDLDAPEEVVSMDEEPEAMDTDEEPSMELEGLKLEMEAPEEPEEENPEQ